MLRPFCQAARKCISWYSIYISAMHCISAVAHHRHLPQPFPFFYPVVSYCLDLPMQRHLWRLCGNQYHEAGWESILPPRVRQPDGTLSTAFQTVKPKPSSKPVQLCCQNSHICDPRIESFLGLDQMIFFDASFRFI